MRLLDVIEYSDPTGNEIVHRIPEFGQADIKWGAQLIVRESQVAVFFRDGKALDTFGPGRYTLTTGNMPMLVGLLKSIANGKTPFSSEVYFVNQKVFTDLKWGTPQPIDLKDPEFGWIPLRAFGTFSIRIEDPHLFLNNLVGTQGIYSTEPLNTFLKGSIRTHLNDLFGESFRSYAEIRRHFEELSGAMKMRLKEDFDKYGIDLRDFFIHDISLTEEAEKALGEVREAFVQRQKMSAIGDMGKYMQMKTAEAIGDMAKQPGGAAGGAMGMGAGLGVGMMMPQMMAQAMQQAQAAAPAAPAVEATCPQCKSPVQAGARFCSSCGLSLAGAKCPSCQADLQPGAKFCSNCGTKITTG